MTYTVKGNTLFDANIVGYFSNVTIPGGGFLTIDRIFPGKIAGYYSGGVDQPSNRSFYIQRFTFAAASNATNVGDLSVARGWIAGNSSETHGYTSGGFAPLSSPTGGPYYNIIDKFPLVALTGANASDVGDLIAPASYVVGQSSPSAGYVTGTGNPPSAAAFYIQRFPFATDTNATNVGSLLTDRSNGSGQSSKTHGYYTAGRSPGYTPAAPPTTSLFYYSIEKFPFSATIVSTTVGTLDAPTGTSLEGGGGQSSELAGYQTSEYTPFSGPIVGRIDKFPFSTDTNATNIGQLTVNRDRLVGQSSVTHGYSSGGAVISPPRLYTNIIDRFPFTSDANAADVGDLTAVQVEGAGQQY